MTRVIDVLGSLRAVIVGIIRRPKDALIVVLLLLFAVAAWKLKVERRKSEELAGKVEGLPPGTQQIIQIAHDRVITRWRDGPTKIEYQDRYLPPEGSLQVITKEGSHTQPPELKIKDYGLTFRLGGGAIYSERLLLEADAKVAYWKRYSALVGVTSQFAGLSFSRHVDDFTPFHNLELFGLAGLSWRGTFRFGMGVRSNF